MGLFLSSLSAGAHLFSSSVSLFDLEPVSSPRPTSPRRCRAQGLSRLAVAPTLPRAPIIARPYLDGSEHDGTLGVVGMTTVEGSPLGWRARSRHMLVFGGCLTTRTMMQSCASAAKLRGGGPILYLGIKAMRAYRDPATSNRHRRPVASVRTGPKLSVCLQRPPFIVPDGGRRPRAPRHRARSATRRSEACAPRPRSWSCASRGRSPCGPDTTVPGRCPSGT